MKTRKKEISIKFTFYCSSIKRLWRDEKEPLCLTDLHSTVVLLKDFGEIYTDLGNPDLHSTVVLLKVSAAALSNKLLQNLHSTVVLLKVYFSLIIRLQFYIYILL